ncbi:MAG: RNA polymerase sigma-70 factor [Marinifilaceae bacterium]|jgi:RNA polymerase sigma-70 factor (ECF subfamily)
MPENEQKIVQKIQQGNLQEFERTFRNFYPLLCHYATSFLKESHVAEEVVQELFYQIWKQRQKLEIHTSLKAYLYRSTYHNCMQFLRKKKQESKYEDYLKHQPQESSSPLESLNEKEIYDIVQDTLVDLPDRCSQIFRMSRFEGLKYQEIAEKLSISVKTVEANMGKALKAFRNNLKDYVGIFLF